MKQTNSCNKMKKFTNTIYIYIEREREREEESNMLFSSMSKVDFISDKAILLAKLPCRLKLYNISIAFLQRGKTTPTNECPGYDTKQFDGEVPVILELWGMRSTPTLPSLPGPLCPKVVTPDRILSMGQIVLNCVLILN